MEVGAEKYLGRKTCFVDASQVELTNQLQAALATFTKCKDIYKPNSHSFSWKLRLFDATVSPVLLYGAGSWTKTWKASSKKAAVCAQYDVVISTGKYGNMGGTHAANHPNSRGKSKAVRE